MNCPSCNGWLPDSAKICDFCGADFMVEPFPVDWPAYSELSSVSPPLTTEELSTFAHETIPNNIPNKKSYYMKKWRKELEGKKALAGFNWAAFFTGSYWFIWRKSYAFALLLYISRLILSFGLRASLYLAHISSRLSNLIVSGIGTLIAIAIGLCANHFYLLRAVRITRQSRIQFNNHKEQLSFIHSKGGTNPIALYVAIVFGVAVYFLANLRLHRI